MADQHHPVIEVLCPGRKPTSVVVDRMLEVGRECDGVLVDDPMTSRRHLAVWSDGHDVLVEDIGSSNGTSVNGARASGPVKITLGDVVAIGDTQISLSRLAAASGSAGTAGGAGPRQTIVRPQGGTDENRSTSIGSLATSLSGDDDSRHKLDRLGADLGQTLTFLFSDIESSTDRAQQLGDQRWFAVLSEHDSLMQGAVARHRGTVVKALGDGYMCTFPTTHHALECATQVQAALARPLADEVIRVRMGLHTGEAIASGDDLFGLHVNIAARVANKAVGGQILVSSVTRAIAVTAGAFGFGPETQVELKGVDGTYGVSEVVSS